MTSSNDQREHLVTDTRHVAATTDGTGRAVAECGRVVVLASLATPVGDRCLDCLAARNHSDGLHYEADRNRLFTDEGRAVLAAVVKEIRTAIGDRPREGSILHTDRILRARVGDAGLVLAALRHLTEAGQLRPVATRTHTPAHHRDYILGGSCWGST